MNDPLFFNKLAGAILTALLLFFGLPQLAKALSGGGHHGGELHLAYPIEFETTAGGGTVEEKPADLGTLMAAASASAGERRSALCKSCHTFEEGGANGTGPNLWNVVNRPIASVSGFNYSAALQQIEGAWTFEKLDKYLANSQAYVPGTTMVQRVAKDEQRADLMAYLASLSDNPVPLPEPAPVEETVPEVDTPAEMEAPVDTGEIGEDEAPAELDGGEE